jgi:hypothetical protein
VTIYLDNFALKSLRQIFTGLIISLFPLYNLDPPLLFLILEVGDLHTYR